MRSKSILVLAMVCVMAAANIASADMVQGINIDFVTIGNVGNAADTQVMSDGTTGYGAVGYEYRIGKYEVTNAQWNAFVAVAGAPTGNPSYGYDQSAFYTGTQQPTSNVSWYEALQFCNYLTSGDKSKGVYQFSGNNANPGDFLGIDRATAQATYEIIYVLPTENEWYKAAYYKPDRSGYSLYANGTNTAPIAGVQSNYNNVIGVPWNVGSGMQEQNGTFDMMGNVWEWNETLYNNDPSYALRGGCLLNIEAYLCSSFRSNGWPYSEDCSNARLGFRIASIPEPNPIQEILDFIEESVADGTLVPVKPGKAGEGQLGALINMIEAAGNLIDANDPNLLAEACGQLQAALGKTDGQERPPDFVTGEATAELASKIEALMTTLGCN